MCATLDEEVLHQFYFCMCKLAVIIYSPISQGTVQIKALMFEQHLEVLQWEIL